MHRLFVFKRSQFNSKLKKRIEKVTHKFAPRPLIFKLQQESSKIK